MVQKYWFRSIKFAAASFCFIGMISSAPPEDGMGEGSSALMRLVPGITPDTVVAIAQDLIEKFREILAEEFGMKEGEENQFLFENFTTDEVETIATFIQKLDSILSNDEDQHETLFKIEALFRRILRKYMTETWYGNKNQESPKDKTYKLFTAFLKIVRKYGDEKGLDNLAPTILNLLTYTAPVRFVDPCIPPGMELTIMFPFLAVALYTYSYAPYAAWSILISVILIAHLLAQRNPLVYETYFANLRDRLRREGKRNLIENGESAAGIMFEDAAKRSGVQRHYFDKY